VNPISRRQLIRTGAGIAATAAAVPVAASLAERSGILAPDARGIFGPGKALTYGGQRLVTSHSMAREFSRDEISAAFPRKSKQSKEPAWASLKAGGFADWRLKVDGLLDRPAEFSVAQLRDLPARSQITHLACEEGWSYIAEWKGTPLSELLEAVGAKPKARYVLYFSIQKNWWDSLDMAEALHPQTLLAYGMNGAPLPEGHGGPLRMRVPRQLGFKNVKFIDRLTVTDSLKGFGTGKGSPASDGGYSWYGGI